MVHRRGRFDRDAAGVESDALADQRHFLRALTALTSAVGQSHQSRWVRGTLTDADNSTEAAFGQCLLIQHLDLEAGGGAQSRCALGEFGGVQVARRGVDQISGGSDRRRDRDGTGSQRLRMSGGAQRCDLRQRRLLRSGLGAAELVHLVGAENQSFDCGLQLQVGQRGDDRAHAIERPRGHPGGSANQFRRPHITRGPESDRQHAGHWE